MSVNQVILLGRAGKDPEVREVGQGGSKVAQFSLCTGGKYTNKDGREIDDTAWHNIVAWRNLAELAQKHISKGSQVMVIGHLNYRKYTDNNGNERQVTDIVADKIELCGARQESQPATTAPAPQQRSAAPAPRYKTTPIVDDLPPDDDGLPF